MILKRSVENKILNMKNLFSYKGQLKLIEKNLFIYKQKNFLNM